MVVLGAKGHAKEVLELLHRQTETNNLQFFDNVSSDLPERLFGRFQVIRTQEALAELFRSDNRFVLGVGPPALREKLASMALELGGELTSVISSTAVWGHFEVKMGTGLNLMHQVYIGNGVRIEEGVLLNAFSGVHHDAKIGSYSEISPGAQVLGGAVIGKKVSVGAGAMVLPNVKIGDEAVIGAGAVVTRKVGNGQRVVGIPARSR